MPDSIAPAQGVPLDQLSFEEALAELEKIVRGLESGQMTLENAIAAYERGAALRRHCEARLEEAEMRVRAIVKSTSVKSTSAQTTAQNGQEGETVILEDITLSPSNRPGEESRA